MQVLLRLASDSSSWLDFGLYAVKRCPDDDLHVIDAHTLRRAPFVMILTTLEEILGPDDQKKVSG